ncbi:MAG: 4Fe-4S dicluster domain-containing protein, partial [Lentisphaeria bacterium]
KMKRKIIKIDKEKCDGCGLCVPACHEGALQIVDGKATLVKDSYCDGLGDCLGECPQGAISFEMREADAYDEQAVQERLQQQTAEKSGDESGLPKPGGGCPGLAAFSFDDEDDEAASPSEELESEAEADSALRQWPVQLKLVPVEAPYWQEADLLVAADCVPTAYGGFHSKLLDGKRLVIACPKLDDTAGYVDKLAAILSRNDIKSLTVAIMEVPCCGGLERKVREALSRSGKDIPLNILEIGVHGDLREKPGNDQRINLL